MPTPFITDFLVTQTTWYILHYSQYDNLPYPVLINVLWLGDQMSLCIEFIGMQLKQPFCFRCLQVMTVHLVNSYQKVSSECHMCSAPILNNYINSQATNLYFAFSVQWLPTLILQQRAVFVYTAVTCNFTSNYCL